VQLSEREPVPSSEEDWTLSINNNAEGRASIRPVLPWHIPDQECMYDLAYGSFGNVHPQTGGDRCIEADAADFASTEVAKNIRIENEGSHGAIDEVADQCLGSA
jgi:hypothetical protein